MRILTKKPTSPLPYPTLHPYETSIKHSRHSKESVTLPELPVESLISILNIVLTFSVRPPFEISLSTPSVTSFLVNFFRMFPGPLRLPDPD